MYGSAIKLPATHDVVTVPLRQVFVALQHSSGVSRDEVAAALIEVAEGRVPKDRVALRELHREMVEWPFLDAEDALDEGTESNYEGITETGMPCSCQCLNRF